MENLTPEQQNKLSKVADFLQKTEVSNLLPFADLLEEIRDTLKQIAEKETPDFPTPPDVQKISIEGADIVTLSPSDERLTNLMIPLIPPAIKGDSYVLTDADKKEIAGKITVPIVEKEIETIIEKQPIVTNEIKEVAVTDTGEQIIEKINSTDSEFKITKEHLDIDDIIKQLERQISSIPRGGGGRASHSTKFYKLTPDGTTKTFSVPKSVTAIVLMSDFPHVLFEGSANGFTINNTRTSITITTDTAPSVGSQLLFQYSEYFNS